jgi:hypothetical protein
MQRVKLQACRLAAGCQGKELDGICSSIWAPCFASMHLLACGADGEGGCQHLQGTVAENIVP